MINHRISAPSPPCLNPEPPVCMQEQAVLYHDVPDSAGHLAADGYGTMTIPHAALADINIFRRGFILRSHVYFAGFYGDTVVAKRKINSDNIHISAGFRIQAVRIGRNLWIENPQIQEFQVFGKIRMDIPAGAVGYRYAFHHYVFAAVQKNLPRPPGSLLLLMISPPVIIRGIAVYGSCLLYTSCRSEHIVLL